MAACGGGAGGSPGGASTNLLATSLLQAPLPPQPAAPSATGSGGMGGVGVCGGAAAVAAAARAGRLQPQRGRCAGAAAATGGVNANAHAHAGRGATAVKLWLLKGVVQKVRKAGDRSARRVRYETASTHNPADGSSPIEMPEASRLIGPRAANADTQGNGTQDTNVDDTSGETPVPNTYTFSRHAIRSNYMDKSIEAKKKVIRMLFVVVAEFFVCWAPLHVLNTWYLFSPDAVYAHVGSTGVSLVQLLAYVSSCCNPITYCFMNRKFRQAFLGIFDCYRYRRTCCCCCCCAEDDDSNAGAGRRANTAAATTGANHSDISGNDSTQGAGRASMAIRSEVVVLEGEDRV